MHIILLFFKIIGIVLLCILGLLAAVLLAILLVPLRYRVELKKDQDVLRAHGRVTWLMHLVGAEFFYDRGVGGAGGQLKIAFKSLKRFGVLEKSDEQEPEKQEIPERTEPEKQEIPERTEPEKQETPERTEPEKQETPEQTEPEKQETPEQTEPEKQKLPDTVEPEVHKPAEVPKTADKKKTVLNIFRKEHRTNEENTETAEDQQDAEVQQRKKFSLQELILKVSDFITASIQKMFDAVFALFDALDGRTEKLGSLVDSALSKKEKLQKQLSEYINDSSKAVVSLVIRRLLVLLKHYRIRKIRGYLKYGTGRPDLTAQIGGVLYRILPAGAAKYEIEPSMYDASFETDTVFTGHVRFCHVLFMLIRLLFSKDVRKLIRQVLRRKKK